MARYSFKCKDCDYEFVITQSIHDDLPTFCPECNGSVQQVYGKVAARTTTGLKHMERLQERGKRDRKLIDKGHDRALTDLVGDKPNPLKSGR